MTKRFKEIISTQKVIDTQTGKEYDCLLDNDLFELINEIAEENEQSKKHREELFYRERDAKNDWRKLKYENEQLKQQKPFLKIHDDYFIQYGDDNELFNLHKPSDIRSLIYLINRENGYDELECEYNEEGYGND